MFMRMGFKKFKENSYILKITLSMIFFNLISNTFYEWKNFYELIFNIRFDKIYYLKNKENLL
jgi:hypothetical protein